MNDDRAKEWLRRANAAWAAATQVRTLYDAMAEVFYPERADFISQQTLGRERYEAIYDAEPARLRWDLQNSIGAMLRPRGRDWFLARAYPRHLNKVQVVREWCEDCTETTRELLYAQRANFAKAMSESDADYVTFGTSPISITPNNDRTGLLFRAIHPRDIAFELDNEGHVGVIYEQRRLSAAQLERMFGREKLGAPIQRALDRGGDRTQTFLVHRVVCPIEQHEGRRAPTSARFWSLYIDPDQQTFLAEATFRTQPILVRRWSTVSGEAWGRSPVTSIALADARTLNVAQRAMLEGLEKAIDPPMLAASENIGGAINLYAGGVTYVEGDMGRPGEVLRPVQEAARLDYGMEFTRERREFQARTFLQNLLRLPADKTMTAYEVGERIEEFLRSAAPVFEPMEAENGQMMDIVFDIAMQHNAYLPPPPELEGQEVRFDFETTLSIAYRRLKLEKGRDLLTRLAETASIYPDAPKHVNWSAFMDDVFDGVGVADWRRDEEEVIQEQNEQLMAQRAQELLAAAQALPPEMTMEALDGGTMVDPSQMQRPVADLPPADPMAGVAV